MHVLVVDGSGKTKSGFLKSQFVDFGDYDQCLKVENAKYHLVRIRWPLLLHRQTNKINLKLLTDNHWIYSIKEVADVLRKEQFICSVCLPNTCSKLELQLLLNEQVTNVPIRFDLTEYDEMNSSYENYFYSLMMVLIAITFIASFKKKNTTWLNNFSLTSNMTELMNSNQTRESSRLDFINGAKTLYTVSSFLSHFMFNAMTYLPMVYMSYTNRVVKSRSNPIEAAIAEVLAFFVGINFVMG